MVCKELRGSGVAGGGRLVDGRGKVHDGADIEGRGELVRHKGAVYDLLGAVGQVDVFSEGDVRE